MALGQTPSGGGMRLRPALASAVAGYTCEIELLLAGLDCGARGARRAARYREDHPAAGHRPRRGQAVRVRGGQRRADPGPAGRALRPLPGPRISAAAYDRACRIVTGCQSHTEESDIVARRYPPVPGQWRDQVTGLVRRTRDHADVRTGSSVRGASDLTRKGMIT